MNVKKGFALVVVAALLISGCALLKTAKNVICAPTPEQQAQAQKAFDFMDLMAGLVGSEFQAKIIMAKNVFLDVLRPGICVSFNDLEKAINTFDEAIGVLKGQIALKSTPFRFEPIVVPDISSLRDVVAKK